MASRRSSQLSYSRAVAEYSPEERRSRASAGSRGGRNGRLVAPPRRCGAELARELGEDRCDALVGVRRPVGHELGETVVARGEQLGAGVAAGVGEGEGARALARRIGDERAPAQAVERVSEGPLVEAMGGRCLL